MRGIVSYCGRAAVLAFEAVCAVAALVGTAIFAVAYFLLSCFVGWFVLTVMVTLAARRPAGPSGGQLVLVGVAALVATILRLARRDVSYRITRGYGLSPKQ